MKKLYWLQELLRNKGIHIYINYAMTLHPQWNIVTHDNHEISTCLYDSYDEALEDAINVAVKKYLIKEELQMGFKFSDDVCDAVKRLFPNDKKLLEMCRDGDPFLWLVVEKRVKRTFRMDEIENAKSLRELKKQVKYNKEIKELLRRINFELEGMGII